MKHRITGVLYGHYDSRGGATFIECTNGRDEGTDNLYAESFWIGDSEQERKENTKRICDDDFLGPAVLESDTAVTHGMDVDYRNDYQKLWVKWKEDANPTDFVYELVVAKEKPPGAWEESELGEDAFGVVVLLREEGTYE
jgi:hypothetical protein